jgi:hypothetical protein
MGFYLPINKMPALQIYKKESLHDQLLAQVRQVNKSQLNATTQNFLVTMPKLLKWFHDDLLHERNQHSHDP